MTFTDFKHEPLRTFRTAALMQTTIAFTKLKGSPKVNVIPDAGTFFLRIV